MVITFTNLKGGSGKTSLCCLLALCWAQQGKRVAIRDMDPQGSSAAFVEHLESPNIRVYVAGGEADFILVDTPGGIRPTDLRNLVEASDLLVIPFLLSPTDMRATRETVVRIAQSPKARLVFNGVNTQTSIFRDRRNYADLLGVPACRAYLGDRVAFKHALVDGWGALTSKARQELTELGRELEKELRKAGK